MAFDPHPNLALSTITTAPSPPTSGTTLTVSAGQGGWFQAPPFNATVWPANVIPTPTNAEIVRVTARTTDTMTIVRAQEGTTARTIGAGDQIAASITAKTLADVETEFATVARVNVENTFTADQVLNVSNPTLVWFDPGEPANSRAFMWQGVAQQMVLRATADDLSTQTDPLIVSRPGDLKVWRDVYEKQRTTPVGHWIDVATDSSSFSMGGAALGNWAAGTIGTFAYNLVGQTMHLSVQASSGQWYVAANQVNIKLPAGRTSARNHFGTASMITSVMPWEICWAYLAPGAQWITIHRNATTNFAAATGVTIFFQMAISVQ